VNSEEMGLVDRIEWTPELVSKFWDGVSQTELDNLSFGKVAGPQFLDLIDSYLLEGRTYLDFGAGSGHILQQLLDRGLPAAGFDPSPDRHSLLIKKVGRYKNFLGVLDANSEQQFDVVLLMEVLEHVLDDDISSTLNRVLKFVKPGGYLVVSTPNNENLELSSVYCPVSNTFFHPWQHVRSFTPSQLSELLSKQGLVTDFLALVDFSCDADLVECYKNKVATEKLKESSLNRIIASLEVSISKYGLKHTGIDYIDNALKNQSQLSFFQKIKLNLFILRNFRSLISTVHSIAHRYDDISVNLINELRQVMQISATKNINPSGFGDEIDLRHGRETTIVYIGKKNDSKVGL
jgi:SAM-dependent methyltransferase